MNLMKSVKLLEQPTMDFNFFLRNPDFDRYLIQMQSKGLTGETYRFISPTPVAAADFRNEAPQAIGNQRMQKKFCTQGGNSDVWPASQFLSAKADEYLYGRKSETAGRLRLLWKIQLRRTVHVFYFWGILWLPDGPAECPTGRRKLKNQRFKS